MVSIDILYSESYYFTNKYNNRNKIIKDSVLFNYVFIDMYHLTYFIIIVYIIIII